MSLLTNVLAGVNWLGAAEAATTNSESLFPLLVKTAIDAFKAAEGGGSLLTVIQDIETDIPAIEAAFSTNNTQGASPPAAS